MFSGLPSKLPDIPYPEFRDSGVCKKLCRLRFKEREITSTLHEQGAYDLPCTKSQWSIELIIHHLRWTHPKGMIDTRHYIGGRHRV